MNIAIFAALILAALRMVDQAISRGAVQQRIAQAVTSPINTDAAFMLRFARRSYGREVEQVQIAYPGAWGDMAQSIADDINMTF